MRKFYVTIPFMALALVGCDSRDVPVNDSTTVNCVPPSETAEGVNATDNSVPCDVDTSLMNKASTQ